MAAENRPSDAGAVAPPPSSTEYSARGVFNTGDAHLASSEGGTGTTADTPLGPSGTTGGGGDVNDSTITLVAGTGLNGTGSFTTNQEGDSTITFNLDDVGMAGQFGGADVSIRSITVDAQGRVTEIQTTTTPPVPAPFADNFQTTADNTQRAAQETPRMETITLMVADGYTINTVSTMDRGDVDVTIGSPEGLGGRTVTIPVTIPATDNISDPIGSIQVETTSLVEETASERTMTEIQTPLNTRSFLPFYTGIFESSFTTASITLGDLTPSDAAFVNGGRLLIPNPFGDGRPDKFAYFALQTNDGVGGDGATRTYTFSFGTFGVEVPVFTTAMMFGRSFNIYEFPTRGAVDLTVDF